MQWCWNTKSLLDWKKVLYLRPVIFFKALSKWSFARLLCVLVVLYLWTMVPFPFKVICFSPSEVVCYLYIHTAPSWQWPLLAPQLSYSYTRLLFHRYSCLMRNVVHGFTHSCWRTQSSCVHFVLSYYPTLQHSKYSLRFVYWCIQWTVCPSKSLPWEKQISSIGMFVPSLET